jgi:GrpB-like predicted nucleotidyltransferase (UPF0157 family)
MDLVREEEIRERVAVVFEDRRSAIAALLPGARIEHVGSTAVPGSLTKGDLDICVSVAAEGFASATQTLSAHYAVHQPENWTPCFASFLAPAVEEIDVGVQLVVAGGPEEEWFIGWRERLRVDPGLLARYDRCKSKHRGAPVEVYREAKERLILG